MGKLDRVLLRSIEDCDLPKVMRWRMSPEITRYMYTDPVLTLEGQIEWLKKIKNNSDVKYYIIEIGGEGCGVISISGLEREDGIVSWQYYIGEKRLSSLFLALSLEMSLYDYIFFTLEKKSSVLNVFSFNEGVIKLHLMCGCTIKEERKSHIVKNGVPYDVTFLEMTSENWRKIRESKRYEKITFE